MSLCVYTFLLQECGINLDVINPSYIKFDHDVNSHFRYNYIECYCSKDKRGDFCKKLRTPKYGAQEAIELSLDQGIPFTFLCVGAAQLVQWL